MIDIYLDYAVVFGVTIPRPSHMARSQWLAFWERYQ